MKKIWYTYEDIHRAIKQLAEKIQQSHQHFDAMIAIGGGGFIPARILRSFLNIPVYTVTLSYYDANDQPTHSPQKIQWTDGLASHIKDKRILIVDEVDDSRVTLQYCIEELQQEGFKDLGVAVLHEKRKPKEGTLPDNMPYFSALVVEDWWINYPWDALDIETHNLNANMPSSSSPEAEV
ncbi:phosphoribosyltransferase [Neisseriaceae bacterium ESL0693]|nr:phosphoribosyltransferase [Neisseriaceae bacterium ESL0693]